MKVHVCLSSALLALTLLAASPVWGQFFKGAGFTVNPSGYRSDDPETAPQGFAAGSTIKDCAECPELVVVPAGDFLMGSSGQEQLLVSADGYIASESPQHKVRVPSFAAGRYAVTKGEFASFVRASGYRTEAEQRQGCLIMDDAKWKAEASFSWRKVGFVQGDDHPVVCVSWNDAQAYIQWLNKISGKDFRLLSDAEWEYAARGGTQTAFWWGENITTSQANYDGSIGYNGGPKGEFRQATVPVNSFSANRFGLHNVHGNVQEWTQDCWHEDYTGAPTDGSAWITGCKDDYRVFRGGAWRWIPAFLRSAVRTKTRAFGRSVYGGFRIARPL